MKIDSYCCVCVCVCVCLFAFYLNVYVQKNLKRYFSSSSSSSLRIHSRQFYSKHVTEKEGSKKKKKG